MTSDTNRRKIKNERNSRKRKRISLTNFGAWKIHWLLFFRRLQVIFWAISKLETFAITNVALLQTVRPRASLSICRRLLKLLFTLPFTALSSEPKASKKTSPFFFFLKKKPKTIFEDDNFAFQISFNAVLTCNYRSHSFRKHQKI